MLRSERDLAQNKNDNFGIRIQWDHPSLGYKKTVGGLGATTTTMKTFWIAPANAAPAYHHQNLQNLIFRSPRNDSVRHYVGRSFRPLVITKLVRAFWANLRYTDDYDADDDDGGWW